MATKKKAFNQTLLDLPEPDQFPLALPLAHLSIARWLKSIIDDGELRPRLCSVFREDLTYFYYGGVFYRPNAGLTRNATECPIAFVFSPKILNNILRMFPFDTGALEGDYFGDWKNHLKPFEKYEVEGQGDYRRPGKIVHYMFGGNEEYLRGETSDLCPTYPAPLPELSEFYNADLTAFDTDQRQCLIECQGNVSIPFKDNLLWIGFPESMVSDVAKLYSWMDPIVPDFFTYETHKIINPKEIAAKLEQEARTKVIARYINRLGSD